MKTYELTYIVSPESTSEEIEVLTKEIESFVQSKDGVVLSQTSPVAKTLAYLIKKHSSGFMVVLTFQSETETIKELEDKIKQNEKVIRHIISVKNPIKERRERRSARPILPSPSVDKKEVEDKKEETSEAPEIAPIKTTTKEKVELKDIEQKLEELLGE